MIPTNQSTSSRSAAAATFSETRSPAAATARRIGLALILLALIVAVFFSAPQTRAIRLTALALSAIAAVGVALGWPSADKGVAPDAMDASRPREAGPELDRVLDALPVGVLTISANGRIERFNAAAADIFGVAAERAPGRALIEIVRNSELDRRVALTLRSGSAEASELLHSGPRERTIGVATRPLFVSGAQGALVIVTDLTHLRELESLRRDFVSNVSHELRTPLTAIKLMIETLQSGVGAQAAEQFLTSIANETNRMIALVEELLDLARLESGKLELHPGSVDVGELCREAARSQRTRFQSSQVEIEVLTPQDPLVIAGDRDKLYQVLVNLLDNAVRHTPPNGKVSLAAGASSASVFIDVSDTGSGIPSTALPHIFERFFVVDLARARGRSGTGLGLAIAKHIVEAHGGTITVRSELGSGSVFRCLLPAGLQTVAPAL